MENLNYLRDNHTNTLNFHKFAKNGKRGLLTESNNSTKVNNQMANKINVNSKQKSKDANSGIKKQNAPLKDSESEILENDVSMLSINDDSQNCRYFLPSAKDLMNETVAKRFSEDVFNRRNLNRNLTSDKLNEYREEILNLSFDGETGGIFVLEILDHMIDLECYQQPLGLNFLEGTNVAVKQRNEIVNILFKITEKLSTDRYSVQNAMAIFDRYVKIKGKSFNCNDLKLLYVTCWYIACKSDLTEYPCIEDVCNVTKIDDSELINEFEVEVLKVVDFYLCIPTPILFLRPLTVIRQRKNVSHNIAKSITEICIADYELAGHPSHIQACASYCLAMALCYRNLRLQDHWTPIIQFVTGVDLDDIRPVVVTIAKILLHSDIKRQFPSIFEEYETIFSVLDKRFGDLETVIMGKDTI